MYVLQSTDGESLAIAASQIAVPRRDSVEARPTPLTTS